MKWVWSVIVIAALSVGAFVYLSIPQLPQNQRTPSQAAEAFFDNANVRLNYSNGEWWLRLDTLEAVLCAVNLGPLQSDFDVLQAMEMNTPATDHDIALNVQPGQSYQLALTVFTSSHQVWRSPTYFISTQAVTNPEQDLIAQREGSAYELTPADAGQVLSASVQVENIGTQRADVRFTSKVPTLASTAFGPDADYGRSARMASAAPLLSHEVPLMALTPGSAYMAHVLLIDQRATVFQHQPLEFETLEQTAISETFNNIALLDRGSVVSAVSGNWGGGDLNSSYGANHAIDNNPTSEWSSDGEGNNAWIEITLEQPSEVNGIGFWTRTMGDSAQISRFRVIANGDIVLGEFDLPDADQVFRFSVPETLVTQLRFEVVESSGGNTGARSIEVYSAQQ
jgi:hypothetical protein